MDAYVSLPPDVSIQSEMDGERGKEKSRAGFEPAPREKKEEPAKHPLNSDHDKNVLGYL